MIWSPVTQADTLPGIVQPGQVEQHFQPEPRMKADRPSPTMIPEADQLMPDSAEEIRFVLTRLEFDGLTVYSEEYIQSYYREFLDSEISLADIYGIASELTTRYRNDGYILSQVVVPAQIVEEGRVRLKVYEGYISRVTMEGVVGDRRNLVQRYADKIMESRPLKNSVLERYLLLINDLPGAFARATIKPSESTPGASEMHIHFSQSMVQGGLSVDNRGGESLGPWWISGDIVLNSLLSLQESTSVRVVSSGNNKLLFGSLAHEHVVGPEGGRLNLAFSAVRAKPKEMFFIPLNLESSSHTASLMYSHPVIRSRSQNLFLRGGLTVHEGETKIFNVVDTRDKLRVFKIGGTYDLADSWHGISLLDMELSRGISGLGSSRNNDMLLSRPNGRVDFTKITLYAARLQSLTSRLSFLAAVNSQYAFNDLLSSELFSFGGGQFGRGYDPSELVGDSGAAMKLELRYSDVLKATPAVSYTAYSFYDLGTVYHRSADGMDDWESASSAGLGLRMGLGRNFSCYAELAKPLTRDVSAKGNRHPRAYWGFALQF